MENNKALEPRNDEIMNYLFRPAKNIERKMLCEALSRLSIISDVKHYQYVGFSSVYFADFSLFHKQLGIQKADDQTPTQAQQFQAERDAKPNPFAQK